MIGVSEAIAAAEAAATPNPSSLLNRLQAAEAHSSRMKQRRLLQRSPAELQILQRSQQQQILIISGSPLPQQPTMFLNWLDLQVLTMIFTFIIAGVHRSDPAPDQLQPKP